MRAWGRGLLTVAALAAIGCGGDDDAGGDEYIAAVQERNRALCSCKTDDDQMCAPTAASECVNDVWRKHAHEFASSLACLTQQANEQLKCIPASCTNLDAFNEIESCVAQVGDSLQCTLPSSSTLAAIDAETNERCVPLITCQDGSHPDERGACPALLPEAGPPQPSCAAEVMPMVGDAASPECVQCSCETAYDATLGCDADCWNLIECGQRFCFGPDAGDFVNCVENNCTAFVGAAVAASTLTKQISGSCTDACAFLSR